MDLYVEEVYCCGIVCGNRKCMFEGIKFCKLKNYDEIIKFFRKMSLLLWYGGIKKLFYLLINLDLNDYISILCK